MTTEAISLTSFFPISPDQLYQAWLNSDEHSKMTGGAAATVQPMVGGHFTACDDYVQGMNVVLEPGRRIVQTWRSADFPQEAEDSRLELVFEPIAGGTMLELKHTDLPEGQADDYKEGWQEHYFTPMKVYFLTAGRPNAAEPPNSYSNHSTAYGASSQKPTTATAVKAAVKPATSRTKNVKKGGAKKAKGAVKKGQKATKKAARKPAKKSSKKKVKKAVKKTVRKAAKQVKKATKAAAKKRKR